MKGLYIHIPFCAKKCLYCDFYSLPASPQTRESYVNALLHESKQYSGMSFQTMYIGGGTPSLLGGNLFSDLICRLKDTFDLADVEEATVEVNPESATREFLEAVKESGFNRISVGVQSLNDNELNAVGRIHTATQALATLVLAKRTGFASVSADVMIGLPGQTWLTLDRTLDTLVHSDIEHISMYCLALEEGTPLAENPPADLPSDDTQAELFQRAVTFLKRYSYIHYEISNFALKGYECKHNLNYWWGGEYLGLGSAAASHLKGKRFKNRDDLKSYLDDPDGQIEDIEELNMKEKACEEAMLRLRLLNEGLDIEQLAKKFGADAVDALKNRCETMVSQEHLLKDGFIYRLPSSRVLTSNPVFAEVLGMGSPE